jgi:hypothetical protein
MYQFGMVLIHRPRTNNVLAMYWVGKADVDLQKLPRVRAGSRPRGVIETEGIEEAGILIRDRA